MHSSDALQRLAGFSGLVRPQYPRPLASPRDVSIEVQKFNGRIPLLINEVVATLAQFFGPLVELDGPHVDVMSIRGQNPWHEGRPRRRIWIDNVVHLGATTSGGCCRGARGDEDFNEDPG